MSEKSKRPWFRFHLLTAVLMMIGAGGAAGVNATPRYFVWKNSDKISSYWHALPGYAFKAWGWPLPAVSAVRDEDLVKINWIGKAVFIDAIVAGGIFLFMLVISEFLLRRREGRKP